MARNGGIGKTAIKRVILNLENTYLGLENGRQLLIGGVTTEGGDGGWGRLYLPKPPRAVECGNTVPNTPVLINILISPSLVEVC